MTDIDPFDLPEDVVDAAMEQLVDASGEERIRALAVLQTRFPAHAAELRALAGALGQVDQVRSDVSALPAADALPKFAGYRIVRTLGEGAFGVVYLCEQSEPIERQVAIKLLRPGAGDRSTLERFAAERRFLARLRHPAIAQIHDAGMLADGRPWFVMEHVDGVPITTWCDRKNMTVQSRLRLFVRLCHGVQHAHEQGIVHRDLKPSNVLVVEVDGEAHPKVIDFGIARALQAPGDGLRTETGRVVGTPGYMSPEQAEGRIDEIDVRSDVWGLGVMLFELLTSTLPWGRRPTTTDSDPVRPSQRLVAEPKELATIAERRGTDARRLSATVRGDLDWIVLKALSHDRRNRYATALDLAADVLRHLRGDAVVAGPPSWRYRLRKFVRRHRVAFATAGCAAVFGAIATWVVSGYRAEATMSSLTADAAVKALLQRANDLNLVAAPDSAALRKALAEEALAFYETFQRQRPEDLSAREGRCRCLATLAQVYLLLGDLARSEAVAREAKADGDALLKQRPDDPSLLRLVALAEGRIGRSLGSQTQLALGQPHFQRAIDLLERAYTVEPEATTSQLVKGLLELASAVGPGARDELLARAETLQEQVCRAHVGDDTEHSLLVDVLTARARYAIEAGDLPFAEQRLQVAESVLDAPGTKLHFGVRSKVFELQADLAVQRGDFATALRSRTRQIAIVGAWREAEPGTMPAHRSLVFALLAQAEQQGQQGESSPNSFEAAIAAAAVWVERLPTDSTARLLYAYSVQRLASTVLVTGRREDLVPIEPMARRACEWLAPANEVTDAPRRAAAWRAHCLLGLVANGLGVEDVDAIWRAADVALDAVFADAPLPEQDREEVVQFYLRIVERDLAAGRDAAAQQRLDKIEAWENAGASVGGSANKPRADLLRSLVALRRGAWQDAEDFARRAGKSNDWRAAVAAADATFAVWDTVRRSAPERAEECRAAALAYCKAAVAKLRPLLRASPDDPWLTVPLLRLRIRHAQTLAGHGPLDLLELKATVDAYAAIGPIVHACEWDDAVLRAGRALLVN